MQAECEDPGHRLRIGGNRLGVHTHPLYIPGTPGHRGCDDAIRVLSQAVPPVQGSVLRWQVHGKVGSVRNMQVWRE